MRGLALIAIAVLCGCGFSLPPFDPIVAPEHAADQEAKVLIDSYICWVWSAYPVEATVAGFHDYDHTFGPRTDRGAGARVETLRYYDSMFAASSSSGISASTALDLHAAQFDLNLRLWRQGSSGPVAPGIWALLYSPNVTEDQRARCLASRLSELGDLRIDPCDTADVQGAMGAIREFFSMNSDSGLRSAGLAAVDRVDQAWSAAGAPGPAEPLGERRLGELISILMHGHPHGDPGIPALRGYSRRWLGQNRSRLEASVREPSAYLRALVRAGSEFDLAHQCETVLAAAAELSTIPSKELAILGGTGGSPSRLVGPERFSSNPSHATYVFRRAHPAILRVEAALILDPGAFVQSPDSPALRLAQNPAIVGGMPLCVLRRLSDGNPGSESAVLWRIMEARALCRLVATLEYHTCRLDHGGVVRLFETEGFMSRDEAEGEATRTELRPEVLGDALGARALHSLQAGSAGHDWERIGSLRGFGIRKLWSVLRRTDPPSDLFAGPAVDNY